MPPKRKSIEDTAALNSPGAKLTRSEATLQRKRRERKARFEANETGKAPEDRLAVRRDLEEVIHRQISRNQRRFYEATVQWFNEFWVEALHGAEDDAKGFWKLQGPIMPMSTMRKYFVWLATSRQGILQSTLSFYTVQLYALRFLNALEYYQVRPIDLEVKQQLLWWVQGALREEAGLHKEVYPKPVARNTDVTTLITTLYSPLSLCSFGTARGVLYFNLFVNLAIDSCGRIGEIVWSTKQPVEHCLRWEDVEIWVKPSIDDTDALPRFYGLITFKWLKGKRMNPKDYKTICLRLLGTAFAFEDTLRQILYLGIIERHFDDVVSWEDLEKIDAHPEGSLIRVSDSSRELPVLRGIDCHCRLTEMPMSDQVVTLHTARLGRMAGFRDRLTSYAFRRGIAHTLETTQAPETRKFMMGHNPRSRIASEYASKTSVIDFQAIARNIEAEDVTHLSAISLGSRTEAPKVVSLEGFNEAKVNPQHRKLDEEACTLMETLRCQYGSFVKARLAEDPRCQKHDEVRDEQRTLFRCLIRRIYRREYRQYFDEHIRALPTSTEDEDPLFIPETRSSARETGPEIDDVDPSDLGLHMTPTAAEATTVEMIREASDAVGGASNPTNEVATEASQALFAEIDRVVIQDDDQERTDDCVENEGSMTAQGLRLHGLAERTGRRRAGSQRTIVPRDFAYENVYKRILEGQLTNREVAAFLIPFYSIMHPLDRFPPHWQPVSGTTICKFCDKEHAGEGFRSVWLCAKKDTDKRAKEWFDSVFAAPSSSWNFVAPSSKTKRTVTCTHDVVDLDDLPRHMYVHLNGMRRDATCKFGDCKGDFQFDNVISQNDHWIDVHQYIPFGSHSCLYFWCPFCTDFVWEIQDTSARDRHYEGHLPNALSMAAQWGYNGAVSTDRAVIPIFDPFLLHDATLRASERLFVYEGGQVYGPREGYRLRARAIRRNSLPQNDNEIFCPATAASETDFILCAYDQRMGADNLLQHLKEIHKVDATEESYPQGKPQKSRARSKGKEQARDDPVDEGSNHATSQHSTMSNDENEVGDID